MREGLACARNSTFFVANQSRTRRGSNTMRFQEFRGLVNTDISDRAVEDTFVQVSMQAHLKFGADIDVELREAATSLNEESAVRKAMTERFERFGKNKAMMHTGMSPETDRSVRGTARDEPESDHALSRRATNAHSTAYEVFLNSTVMRRRDSKNI